MIFLPEFGFNGTVPMKISLTIMISIMIAMIIYLFLSSPSLIHFASSQSRETCLVNRITDGDTIRLDCNGQLKNVRIWGVDAPETRQRPWGQVSTEALERLIVHPQVSLETRDVDQYGRTVGRIFSGKRDVGLTLVKQGHAVVYKQFNRDPAYLRAEEAAINRRIGIWSRPGLHQDPAEFRRRNRS